MASPNLPKPNDVPLVFMLFKSDLISSITVIREPKRTRIAFINAVAKALIQNAFVSGARNYVVEFLASSIVRKSCAGRQGRKFSAISQFNNREKSLGRPLRPTIAKGIENHEFMIPADGAPSKR